MNRITQDIPVSYQIIVQGKLDRTWSDYLGGLAIRNGEESGQLVSTLSGQVSDQAALIGVLNSLYDLGYSLLSVEYQARLDSR